MCNGLFTDGLLVVARKVLGVLVSLLVQLMALGEMRLGCKAMKEAIN
jgi:hypothetical protein